MQRVDALSYRVPHIAAVLGGIVALSIFAYGALLLFAVSHTASRAEAQRQMRDIASAISELEASYLEATRSITPEMAAQRGFVRPQSTATVYATAAHEAITLGNLSEQ